MLVTRPLNLTPDRVFRLDALPRIGLELLHAEADAVGLMIDADDLHPHGLSDRQHLGRVVDPPPGDVGDVQKAVDAAEIDEGAVVGDVLDHPFDDLALLEALDQLGTLLGAGLFEDGAAGDDDIAAALVHLQDLEGLRIVHERGDVAHRTDVDLAPRQEGYRTVEIDGEAALDLVEDDAGDLLVLAEGFLELHPALFAPGLFAGEHRLAERVLDALEIDLDDIADLEARLPPGDPEFLDRDPALGLQADIDDREILLDADDGPFYDAALDQRVGFEGLDQEGGKIFFGRLR